MYELQWLEKENGERVLQWRWGNYLGISPTGTPWFGDTDHLWQDIPVKKKDKAEDTSEKELKKMMQDPKYWREQDPEYVKKIEAGFKKLYGGKK